MSKQKQGHQQTHDGLVCLKTPRPSRLLGPRDTAPLCQMTATPLGRYEESPTGFRARTCICIHGTRLLRSLRKMFGSFCWFQNHEKFWNDIRNVLTIIGFIEFAKARIKTFRRGYCYENGLFVSWVLKFRLFRNICRFAVYGNRRRNVVSTVLP